MLIEIPSLRYGLTSVELQAGLKAPQRAEKRASTPQAHALHDHMNTAPFASVEAMRASFKRET
jgi:hypothetical protein